MEIFLLVSYCLYVSFMVFWLVGILRLRVVRKRNTGCSNRKNTLVITFHNEEKRAKPLLEWIVNSVKNVDSTNQLVMVDDRSTDGTFRLLKELAEKLRHRETVIIRIHRTPGNIDPRKYALKEGIKVARNKWILRTDADTIPTSLNWYRLHEFADEGRSNIVGGLWTMDISFGMLIRKPWLLLVLADWFVVVTHMAGWTGWNIGYMVSGKNMALDKWLFLHCWHSLPALWKTNRGGDDDLLIHMCDGKVKVVVSRDIYVKTTSPESFKRFWKSKGRHLWAGKWYRPCFKICNSLFWLSCLGFWTGLLLVGFTYMSVPLTLSRIALTSAVFYFTGVGSFVFAVIAALLEPVYALFVLTRMLSTLTLKSWNRW